MWPSSEAEPATAGFTLVEMLVALVLVATALSSMTALVASTARTNRAIDGFLPMLSTARAVMSALPDRNQLAPGDLTGAIGEHRWRLHVTPFAANEIATRARSLWVPELVMVTVQTKNGAKQFSTVRLQRNGDRP